MIQVLQRAAKILDSYEKDPMQARSLTELAALIQVEAPTCANIVKSLVELGFLEPLPMKKGYRLGPTPWRLTAYGPYMKQLVDRASPIVHDVSSRLRESTILSVLEGPRRVKLLSVDSNRLLRPDSGGMVEGDAIRYATSRVQLAFMEAAERRAWVSRSGWPGPLWNGISDEAALEDACRLIRDAGWAEASNVDEDLIGIAFPVFQQKRVVAAFGIFLPASRWAASQRDALLAEGRAAAEKISSSIS